ncbi:hypothetical protein [Pseudotabrizicola algicola]|uniref:Uncharacterized protein n=1 Tax=Pseudotabrizicola algicola TaxID=2709381 RepID=A0A6B3RNU8_9RHOB|nr:hypothetical protein [Pseudotabrizicola algicola]NEX46528.1 hypothetical protein [Pseudotabrizicola algicola]
MFKTVFCAAIISSSVLLPAPSSAQTVAFDANAVRTACATSSLECLAAVRAAIAGLRQAGLSIAALNTQLGILAGTALGAAAALPAAERTALANVLREIAAASTNSDQIASLTSLAAQLEADAASVDLTAVAQAFSAN